jgi:hypothetical protein
MEQPIKVEKTNHQRSLDDLEMLKNNPEILAKRYAHWTKELSEKKLAVLRAEREVARLHYCFDTIQSNPETNKRFGLALKKEQERLGTNI